MEKVGIEPTASCLQGRRSIQLSYIPECAWGYAASRSRAPCAGLAPFGAVAPRVDGLQVLDGRCPTPRHRDDVVCFHRFAVDGQPLVTEWANAVLVCSQPPQATRCRSEPGSRALSRAGRAISAPMLAWPALVLSLWGSDPALPACRASVPGA